MLFMIIPSPRMLRSDPKRFFAYLAVDAFALAVFIAKIHHFS